MYKTCERCHQQFIPSYPAVVICDSCTLELCKLAVIKRVPVEKVKEIVSMIVDKAERPRANMGRAGLKLISPEDKEKD